MPPILPLLRTPAGMTSGYGHRVLQWAAGSGGLPPQEITFARILQGQGYVTGLVGELGVRGGARACVFIAWVELVMSVGEGDDITGWGGWQHPAG